MDSAFEYVLQAPIVDIEEYWSPVEKRQISRMLKHSIVGSAVTVRRELESYINLTKADELMVVTTIYDHDARVRSNEIVGGVE